jgi:hypothetical protein
VGVESDAVHRINPSVFEFIFTWSPRWCHVHHSSLLLRQFWAKLKNSSPTCFQAKQAGRSRRVSRTVLLLSFFWRNRQTVVHLVLSHKSRNSRGDFKAQITKPELLFLRLKPGNLMTFVLMPNQEIRAPRLLVHGADRTWRHLTFRSFSHRVPNLCLTNHGPLHQVFYSCLDPYHCPSYRTCHLHTTRQANVILHKR